MFNHKDYYYFVFKNPISSGSWSFTGYGSKKAIAGIQPDGTENAFVVSFSQRERIYRFRRNQKVLVRDFNQSQKPELVELYAYVKGHPACEGSDGDHSLFKEMDEIKDAKLVVDNKKRRINAENLAVGLEGDALTEMARLITVFSNEYDVKYHRVLEFAGQQPDRFMELYASPDKAERAVIRAAVEAGILKKMGKLHTWENTTIGADEDDVVSYFIKEPDKLKALKTQLKKLK